MGGNREKENQKKCRLLTFNGIFRKICLDPWFLYVFGILKWLSDIKCFMEYFHDFFFIYF